MVTLKPPGHSGHYNTMNATIIRAVVLMIVGLSVTHALEYLEPNVQRIVGVLPTSVCNELIRLGEQGQ